MKKISRREAMKKGGWMVMGAAIGLSANGLSSGCSDDVKAIGADEVGKMETVNLEKLKITIVYDNNPYKKGLELDWGFSCVVEGLDKTILFDTGRFDSTFLTNLAKLDLDTAGIETVFLSHEHPDHVGGLYKFLKKNPKVDVYLPTSFSSGLKNDTAGFGARVIEVQEPMLINKDCLSSGEMKNFVKNEHSLYIPTPKGLIVITGCAHSGIVDIIRRANIMMNQEVFFVLGGFHLLNDPTGKIENIAAKIKELGVKIVAPTHCSGPDTRDIFSNTPGIKYLDCGVGRIITTRDLV